jgi:multicomponent Na+:H+ antiporter subunit A
MQYGMGFLALLCLVSGIAPQVLASWVVSPAVSVLGFASENNLTWLGLHSAQSGAPVMVGAAILLAALLLAGLIFAVTRLGRTARTVSIFTGGDPVPAGDNAGAEDYAALAETVLQPVYTATNPDPLYLQVWRGISGLAGWVNRILTPVESRPLLVSIILAGLIAAAAWLR